MNAVAGNNPYVGPRPFETKDRLYGREREVTELDHLLSAERIVLLYSPSGAGKSSLINAGIIPRLDWYYALKRDQPTAGRFDCWPPTRVNNPLPTDFKVKNRFAWSAAMGFEQEVPDEFRRSPQALADLSLKDAVAGRRRRSGAPASVLLIFDQFEEFLRIDPLGVPEKEAFFDQLGELLHDPQIWALFVLREDYLAALDSYSRRLPTHLTHRYRIDRLSPEGAAEAMEGPTQDTPRKFAEGVVKQLVTDLAQVQVQQPDGTFVAQTGLQVEPMHLQVVCVGLWDRMVPDDLLIDADDVTTFGDVGRALANYYDSSVAKVASGDVGNERRIREWFDDHLITPDGVRRQVLLGVDQSEGLPNTQIDELQDTYLVRVEQRARAIWFELAHDRLINPIRRSNEEWRSRNLALFQRQAKLWAENARPDDMLFAGGELAEALRFAESNPESLSEADDAFLAKSKWMRDQIEAEQQRTREIERKSREIADMSSEISAQNQRLQTWQRRLLVTSVAALGAFVLSLCTCVGINQKNTELERQDLLSQLQRSVAMAREGALAEALAEVDAIAAKIKPQPEDDLEIRLDQSLIAILGNHPPAERRLGSHDHIVSALRFSANGERLYSGGWDERLKAWPIEGPASAEQTPKNHHTADIRSLAYHGGRQLLVSTDRSGLINLWNVGGETPRFLYALDEAHLAHTGDVRAAALSPDGSRLATGGEDKCIVLWDISKPDQPVQLGKLVNRFHLDGIYRLAYIENGLYEGSLVSGDWGGRVGVWQVPDPSDDPERGPDLGFCALGTEGGPVAVFSLAVSPSGRWIAVGDNLGGVRAWDLDQAAGVVELRFPSSKSHRGKVFDMAFSADSTKLVTVGDRFLIRWEFPSDPSAAAYSPEELRVQRFVNWGEKLHSVAFRPGSNPHHVAVGGAKTVWLADLSRANPLASRIEADGAPPKHWSALATTPDLALLAALGSDQRLNLWRWDGERYQASAPINSAGKLDQIALAPDGRTLVGLSCSTGKLFIHSLTDAGSMAGLPEELASPSSQTSEKCAITFAPTEQSFATGIGNSLQLWSRSASGTWQESDKKDVAGRVLALAFSPNGDHLASAGDRLAAGGDRAHILLWEVVNTRLYKPQWPSKGTLGEYVSSLAFDREGELLAAGADDAIATVWRLPGLDEVSQSGVHDRSLTALVSGRRFGTGLLVSADAEGQLVLCAEGIDDKHCARLGRRTEREIRGLAANADLSRLVVAEDRLWVWDLRRQTMLDAVGRLRKPDTQDVSANPPD